MFGITTEFFGNTSRSSTHPRRVKIAQKEWGCSCHWTSGRVKLQQTDKLLFLYHAKKGLKCQSKWRISQNRHMENDEQKMLGVLLAGKVLGSTPKRNACAIQYGRFLCLPSLTDFDSIYIYFQNRICWNVQTKTSSKLTKFFLWRTARSRK